MPTKSQARPVMERILARTIIDPETGCWRWPGAKDWDGYGMVQVGSRTDGTYGSAYVHRVVYTELVGPIRHTLDHVYERGCRYRDCHNPDHLEDVSIGENIRRSRRSRR